jgi:hypothetical protein
VIRVLLAREPIWFGHRHSGRIRARIAQRYRNECHCFPGGSILRVEGWTQQLRKYTYIRRGLRRSIGATQGIVTQFTFKAFPQTQVWGGTITYDASQAYQLTKATADFAANNTDPLASVLTSYGYFQGGGVSEGANIAILFYDAPSPPAGLFDGFLTNNSNTEVFTRSFLSLVQSSNANSTWGLRAAFSTISVLAYPEDFLGSMLNQSAIWGAGLPLDYGYVTFNAEPVLPSIYNHTTSPSAWPGSRAFPFSPLSILFAWTGNGTTDDVIVEGIKESAAILRADAPETEQLSLYGNYALADTPLEAIYGVNVERLTSIKKEVDPENVMGLAGGFKF